MRWLDAAGWSVDVITDGGVVPSRSGWDRVAALPETVRVSVLTYVDPPWRRPILTLGRLLRRRPGRPEVGATAAMTRVSPSNAPPSASARVWFSETVVAFRQRRWSREALALAEDCRGADLVISSGPPHDVHVVGARLARKRGIPYVVDLRDPLVGDRWAELVHSPRYVARLPTIEAELLPPAAAVLVNTPRAGDAALSRLPQLRGKLFVVPNGSDGEPAPARVLASDAPFRIVHTGTIYANRDPRPFLQAIRRVASAGGAPLGPIEVFFLGPPAVIDGVPLPTIADAMGLGSIVRFPETASRSDAVALQQTAAMLVAFQSDATPHQVPAKLYEYTDRAAWLLALTPPDSATADLLAGTQGVVVDIGDEMAIASAIAECIRRTRAGEPLVPVNATGAFSRARSAETVVRLLDRLVPQPGAGVDPRRLSLAE